MKIKFIDIFFICIILYSSNLCADELVIKLKSGNLIKIKYTGQIQGVEMAGGNDAIENLSIIGEKSQASPYSQNPPSDTTKHDKIHTEKLKESERTETMTSKKSSEKEAKKDETGQEKVRFRIAPPKFGED